MRNERVQLLAVGSLAAIAGFAAWHAVMWVVGLEWWARAAALGAWLVVLGLSGCTMEATKR